MAGSTEARLYNVNLPLAYACQYGNESYIDTQRMGLYTVAASVIAAPFILIYLII